MLVAERPSAAIEPVPGGQTSRQEQFCNEAEALARPAFTRSGQTASNNVVSERWRWQIVTGNWEVQQAQCA